MPRLSVTLCTAGMRCSVSDFSIGRGGSRLIDRTRNKSKVENNHNTFVHVVVTFDEDYEVLF
jgi:hypothetical protein